MADSLSSNTAGTSDSSEMPMIVNYGVESGYAAESVVDMDSDSVIFWRDLVDEDIVVHSDDDIPLDVLVQQHNPEAPEEEDSNEYFHVENLDQVHLLPELHSHEFYDFWVERGFFNVIGDFADLNIDVAYDADVEMDESEDSLSESSSNDSDRFSV